MVHTIAAVLHPSNGVLDPEGMLSGFGSFALVAACLILFIESGILFGMILPGDSLLFIVGVFIASGFISTPLIPAIIAMAICATLGNLLGYWIGKSVGPKLFSRPNSRIFKQEHVETTRKFFAQHGARAIVLARFVPFVRSIITAMAGIGRMNYKVYATYSTVGGILWVLTLTFAGYLLGNITFVRENIDFVTLCLVVISSIPIYLEVKRQKKSLNNL
jgi:membrane-associated protein